jgi:hypothetical protein
MSGMPDAIGMRINQMRTADEKQSQTSELIGATDVLYNVGRRTTILSRLYPLAGFSETTKQTQTTPQPIVVM